MKLKYQLLFAFLFFLFHLAEAQEKTTFKVVDGSTQKNIPFATIVYLDGGIKQGFYTDSLGNCTIIKANGNLQISCIGYQTIKINGTMLLKNQTIALLPLTYQLNPVEIKPKKTKTIRLGYFIDKVLHSPIWHAGFFHKDSTNANYIVQFIPNLKRDSALLVTKLLYNLTNSPKINNNGLPKIPCNATRLRFHLFSVNNVTGKPDKELLTKNILVQNDCSKDNLLIGVADENIYLPSNGVFVGLEYIVDAELSNWYPYYIFGINNGKNVTSFSSYHQRNWKPMQGNTGTKAFVRFGIEVVKYED